MERKTKVYVKFTESPLSISLFVVFVGRKPIESRTNGTGGQMNSVAESMVEVE